MGIRVTCVITSHLQEYNSIQFLDKGTSTNPMSQDYQQGIYSFSNEFERSQQEQHQQAQQQQHIAQQIRRDKLRDQGFDPPPPPSIVGIEEKESAGVVLPVYETVGMLSEMFSFPSGGVPTATELLESQISQSYRNPRQMPPPTGAASANDWFLHRQGMVVAGGLGDSKNQISNINNAHDPAAAMQLFLMNSQQQRSPSPTSSHHHHPPTSSTLHMLLPNHSSSPNSSNLQAFHNAPGSSFGQFTWVSNSQDETNPNEIHGVMEGQGLSLSLSSSLQHLEAVKAEELRMREGEMLCFGQGGGPSNSLVQYQFKNLNAGTPASSSLHLQGGVVGQNYHLQVGLGSSLGTVNILRNSKYAKAAQELLEEFCNVGRSQFKKNKLGQHNHNSNNANPSSNPGGGGINSSSSSKDLPPLSSADRLENQRRKIKLISMVEEVDRRYSHYCEQMQMVVNSFDMVMGFGSAVPYTCLAQKAMSRHFRCLKDAISAQLKHTCELLGEKDGGTSGITKGETPRLKILEQSLRQQRAFHQMGMMQQEAWRPQRGLPDRSVNVLRAWLFEHFLHPYPSDADKHLLARQTGLSRNQVSNWFINARVRLWKPMVEEMYQQEAKDQPDPQRDHSGSDSGSSAEAAGTNSNNAQTSTPHATTTTAIIPPPAPKKSHEINAPESDPSFIAINNRQRFSENQASFINTNNNATTSLSSPHSFPAMQETDSGRRPGNGQVNESSTLIRFGANAGDVSLTLGLRHAGNLPEKSRFSIRDFVG